MALTPAEKMKRRREKLKKEGKYEEYKAIQRERKRYQNSKKELKMLPAKERKLKLKKEREKIREKVAKHRKLKSEKCVIPNQTPIYKTASSMGRATHRAYSALPKSPRKKKLIVRKLFETYGDYTTPSQPDKTMHQNRISLNVISKVKAFYERDDISRQAPGIKDVVTVRQEDGTKIKMQLRHLSSSINETHQMFCSEFGALVGKSKFAELRPKHVMLSNKMPHNVCLCKYHENFMNAINSFHKFVQEFPSYNHNFILENIICEEPTENCWLSKCSVCMDSIRHKLDAVLEKDAPAQVKWEIWKDEGKLIKATEEGTSHDLAEYIATNTPQFLKHSYIKRSQAGSYQEQREKASSSSFNKKSALMQVDFSENFTCIAQDEIQSFHWVQPQVSLFTVSLWYSGKQHPIVIVSDNLDHSKNTIIPYIDKILKEIPNSIEEVKIWSDGPSSQFKNRYIAAGIDVLQRRYNKNIIWNYFATSHGKGPVDGIGGAIKRQVRTSVIQRKSTVFNAKQFALVSKEVSNVTVIEMTDKEIEKKIVEMNLEDIFENASAVPGISEAHCLYWKQSSPITCMLTKYVNIPAAIKPKRSYDVSSKPKMRGILNASGSSCSEDDDHTEETMPKLEDIQNGRYVLVKFDGPRKIEYRYVAVCLSDVDDGDVKIMCLKLIGDSGDKFKVDETDISYTQFSNILRVLPTPSLVMKGNRLTYQFSSKIDVFEKA